MKKFTFSLLSMLCYASAYAQPVVSLVHNDVNTLIRTTPTNLVTNGSFETGGPSTGGTNAYFWSRPCNTNVPGGWTADGDAFSYAYWGFYNATEANQQDFTFTNSTCTNTLQTGNSTIMIAAQPDGNNLIYFGNYEFAINGPAPAYNATTGEYIPRANVAAADAAIAWTAGTSTKGVKATQTVTGLTPGNYYELEFWVTGENFGAVDGLFQLEVGGKKFWLTCP